MSPVVLRVLMVAGVLIFAGTGVAAMLLGGNFLDYGQFTANPKYGQHYGILVVEFGVGVTVASTMMMIFFAFAGRRERVDEQD